MKILELYIICALIGYFMGGLNPSYLLAKVNGFDIRERGSKNAGASNATITMGKRAGVFCALFDILKAYLAVKMCMKLYPVLRFAGLVAGAFSILGHIFPMFMHFQGGKGLASLGGVVMAYDAKIFVSLLLLELLVVLISNYICFVPISGSAIFMIILFIGSGAIAAIIFSPVVAAIYYRHKENLRRIQYGIEARVSYLWNMNEETDRIQKNWDNLTEAEQRSFGLQ